MTHLGKNGHTGVNFRQICNQVSKYLYLHRWQIHTNSIVCNDCD